MSDFNEMTAASLANVFGIALMHPSEAASLEEIMQTTPFLNRVVELMVTNYETVFDDTSKFGYCLYYGLYCYYVK